MARYFIINAYGRSNRGDSVLLEECIADIKYFDGKAAVAGAVFEGLMAAEIMHPEVQWSDRIGNKEGQGLRSLAQGSMYLLSCLIEALAPFIRLSKIIPSAQRASFNSMKQADFIISAPGGYIHDTNLAYFVALANIHIGLLMGKKVVLAPQSIGPIRSRLGIWYARHVLRRVDRVCVRESYSRAFCLEVLQLDPERTITAGDSAFWNANVSGDQEAVNRQFTALGVTRFDRPILGITCVGWNFPHSGDPERCAENYVSAFAEAIDRLCDLYGFVPVVFNQVEEDIATTDRVASRMRHKLIIDREPREPEILRAMIAKSTLFLGSRFHSCIFAMMADIPTVAIAYLPKTRFIMNDLALPGRVTDIDAVDVAFICSVFSADMADLPAARTRTRQACEAYRRRYTRLRDVFSQIPIRNIVSA